jgi:chorismate mutase
MTQALLLEYRAKIDRTDEKILTLLAERAELALQLTQFKLAQNLPILDADREREILDRASKLNPGPLSDSSIVRLFTSILEESRALQMRHVGRKSAS